MAVTTSAPILQAVVQALRASVALKAAVRGEIHEGFAPQGTKKPFLVYQVHALPVDYDWSNLDYEALIDIFIYADNSVDARNIDALVFTTMQEAPLAVTGQSTLICRRIMEITHQDVSEEGKKIYQVGGVWEIQTTQPRI